MYESKTQHTIEPKDENEDSADYKAFGFSIVAVIIIAGLAILYLYEKKKKETNKTKREKDVITTGTKKFQQLNIFIFVDLLKILRDYISLVSYRPLGPIRKNSTWHRPTAC